MFRCRVIFWGFAVVVLVYPASFTFSESGNKSSITLGGGGVGAVTTEINSRDAFSVIFFVF